MKLLQDLLYRVPLEATVGSLKIPVNALAFDSRKVEQGGVFIALKGTLVNGHDFLDAAIAKGAVALVVEQLPTTPNPNVVWVQTSDTHQALGLMAANYYDNPAAQLQLVGVTGTNGKTSVASLLFALLKKCGYTTGLISTIAIEYGTVRETSSHTTPDPLSLNKHLKAMLAVGVTHCFMEVSSHGIAQGRIAGLQFAGGIFTNLTHDHLDYHGSFSNYRDVKKQFFDALPKASFALTNKDDKNGLFMLQNTAAKKHTYALKNYADFSTQILESQFQGMLLKIQDAEVWTPLVGGFNAYNLLAVYACAQLLGLEHLETLQQLSTLTTIDGRFQTFVSPEKVIVIVDYAHTPDALKNVLQTINAIRTKNENLITVIGCGGNRDVEKRPLMGNIAAQLSDKVIFTSDNPRDENPKAIIEAMLAGVAPEDHKKTLKVTDRKEAITVAHHMSKPQDVILIAGKGHEAYQLIKGERIPFDDFQIAKTIFSNKA